MTELHKVTLTRSEFEMAVFVGAQRHVDNLLSGRADQKKEPPEGEWERHVRGAIGEQVVAKRYGKYWSGELGDIKADDVGTLQVRATWRDNGHLIMHDSDKDHRIYILVTGRGPTFNLRGWLFGRDCKFKKWWPGRNPDRPAYWLPQSVLNKMDYLPTWEIAVGYERDGYGELAGTHR